MTQNELCNSAPKSGGSFGWTSKTKKQRPKQLSNIAIQHQQVLNTCIKMTFQIPNPSF